MKHLFKVTHLSSWPAYRCRICHFHNWSFKFINFTFTFNPLTLTFTIDPHNQVAPSKWQREKTNSPKSVTYPLYIIAKATKCKVNAEQANAKQMSERENKSTGIRCRSPPYYWQILLFSHAHKSYQLFTWITDPLYIIDRFVPPSNLFSKSRLLQL